MTHDGMTHDDIGARQCRSLSLSKNLLTKETLGAHDMENKYSTTFLAIEDSAGGLHDLPIAPPLELWRF